MSVTTGIIENSLVYLKPKLEESKSTDPLVKSGNKTTHTMVGT